MDMADSNDVTNSCLEDSNSEYFPCSPVPSISGESVFVAPRRSKRKASPLYKTSVKKSTPVRKSSTTKAKQTSLFLTCCFVLLMILNSRISLHHDSFNAYSSCSGDYEDILNRCRQA